MPRNDLGDKGRTTAGMPGMGAKASRRLRIGDLVLDTGTRSVHRAHRQLALPTLSYRLLLALADAAPNVLTVAELIDLVWPGRVISPETITQRVRLLRRALDDDAQSPRYVGLVRGQGYRLLCEVTPIAAALAPARATPAWRRPRLGLALLLCLGAVAWLSYYAAGRSSPERLVDGPLPNTIAVLPFVNASEHPADMYISDGIADELRDQLGRIGGLKVSARASSLVFRRTPADARIIARQLGVRWLIEGTVRRQQDKVSISVQVVDGESGFSVRSERFDRDMRDLLGMQQEIAGHIVAEISSGTALALTQSAPATADMSAYELLLVGRQLEHQVRDAARVDFDTLDRAIELYRDAIRQDPNSAEAYGRLAGALIYRGDVAGAKDPIDTALRIDPDLSGVQYVLGLYRWRTGDARAGEALERAVALNPNNVDAIWDLAKWLWHQPEVNGPGELFRQGLALDPLTLSRYADLGNYYGIEGMREQALEIAARIERQFPGVEGNLALARVYEVTGDLDVAIASATRALLAGPDRQDAAWQLAELYARLGDTASAQAYEPDPGVGQLFFERQYEELIDVAEIERTRYPEDLKLRYLLGFAYVAEGQYAEAREILQQAGLPATALSASRLADAVEALATLMNAMVALGQEEQAAGYAEWLVRFMQGHYDTGAGNAWWPALYQSCALAVLGRDREADARLASIDDSTGLVWYPVLRDAPCFRQLGDDGTYTRVLHGVEARMRRLRERVPRLLAEQGLDQAVRQQPPAAVRTGE